MKKKADVGKKKGKFSIATKKGMDSLLLGLFKGNEDAENVLNNADILEFREELEADWNEIGITDEKVRNLEVVIVGTPSENKDLMPMYENLSNQMKNKNNKRDR